MAKMNSITDPEDLVTTYEQTRAGFLRLALEKNKLARPYVKEAKALKHQVKELNSPEELHKLKNIRPALLSASGLSDKAMDNLKPKDYDDAIQNLIDEFLEPAGSLFVDELVFRFLLTKGDSLGGKTRNVAGNLGEIELLENIISIFGIEDKRFHWLHRDTKKWIPGKADEAEIGTKIKGLAWENESEPRTLILNMRVPIVRKNIDLCLFKVDKSKLKTFGKRNDEIHRAQNYIALGELKGGIDPAGADEHWKTARSALQRVTNKFSNSDHMPHLFFIGAAIQKHMAGEIFDWMEEGTLQRAANLTSEDQIIEISQWLIRL